MTLELFVVFVTGALFFFYDLEKDDTPWFVWTGTSLACIFIFWGLSYLTAPSFKKALGILNSLIFFKSTRFLLQDGSCDTQPVDHLYQLWLLDVIRKAFCGDKGIHHRPPCGFTLVLVL